jgi:hypothetical protein
MYLPSIRVYDSRIGVRNQELAGNRDAKDGIEIYLPARNIIREKGALFHS